MIRRGLGKGLGMGYKNLAPMDSHIHSLSAKGVRTFEQRLVRQGKVYKNPKGEGYVVDFSKWSKEDFDDAQRLKAKVNKDDLINELVVDANQNFYDSREYLYDILREHLESMSLKQLKERFPSYDDFNDKSQIIVAIVEDTMENEYDSKSFLLEMYQESLKKKTVSELKDMIPEFSDENLDGGIKLKAKGKLFEMYGSKWSVLKKGKDTVLLKNRMGETLTITREEYEKYKPTRRYMPVGEAIESVINAKGTLKAQYVDEYLARRKKFMQDLKKALKKKGLNARIHTVEKKKSKSGFYGEGWYEKYGRMNLPENEVSIVMEKYVDHNGNLEGLQVGVLGYPVTKTAFKKIKDTLDRSLIHYKGGMSETDAFVIYDADVLMRRQR